ncbi:hypothetical protein GCM10023081_36920 [Arthrobacter ginkgonis]|uniref:Uncharacterized protein n=1 Tax=Arthrobacter ginkgonis TaxID=1630594 RepID=A0ABP7CXJ3_9MICC
MCGACGSGVPLGEADWERHFLGTRQARVSCAHFLTGWLLPLSARVHAALNGRGYTVRKPTGAMQSAPHLLSTLDYIDKGSFPLAVLAESRGLPSLTHSRAEAAAGLAIRAFLTTDPRPVRVECQDEKDEFLCGAGKIRLISPSALADTPSFPAGLPAVAQSSRPGQP